MYIKIPDVYPYAITDLIIANPTVKFPHFIEMTEEKRNEKLAEWGVFPVADSPKPTHNAFTEKVVETFPVQSNGKYIKSWQKVSLTSSEKELVKNNIVKKITEEAQKKLDAFAQEKNYDNILSACSYANSTNPSFKADGLYCIQLRDQIWSILYKILEDSEAGKRQPPTSFEDIKQELPQLTWPV